MSAPSPFPRTRTEAALGQAETQLRVYCQCWEDGEPGEPGGGASEGV